MLCSSSKRIKNRTASCDGTSKLAAHQRAAAKGKRLNELGLYDMSGNVYEWCQDWYDETYYSYSPSANPEGPQNGYYRVFRGGGRISSVWGGCRVSYRGFRHPGGSDSDVGLRLVLVP